MPFFCASPHRVFTFAASLVLGFCLVFVLSLPATSQAPATDPDDFIEGNYWALIIGIDTYPALDKDKQLTVARKDAEAVTALLVEQYGFEKKRMVELYDETATRKGILRAFSALKRRLTDKDSLFIYYAGRGGHGDDPNSTSYWLPSDAELDDKSSFFFDSQIRDYLANLPARHVYLVMDSDFSNSLFGRTRALSRGAIRELYQEKSRWALISGGLYPVPDVADKSKNGHSTFAWHFMKILRDNTNPYLLAKNIIEPLAIRVSNEVQGQLPRGAPVVGTGDEGGQFIFRMRKEFRKQDTADKLLVWPFTYRIEPNDQLKEKEETLKRQQEEMAKKKQEMLERLQKLREEKASETK